MPLAPSERKIQSRGSRNQREEEKQISDLSKRLSTSTPNLRQPPPRHYCGITDDEQYAFKATPIPASSRELLFDSLPKYAPKRHFYDRQYSSLPPWEKDEIFFGTSKPFYPSGPNSNKRDDRIQRIKDARELYKTPRTRQETAGSVDDLLKDTKPPRHTCSPRCCVGLGHQKRCMSASVSRLDLLKTPPSTSPRISRKSSAKSSSSDINIKKKKDRSSPTNLQKSKENLTTTPKPRQSKALEKDPNKKTTKPRPPPAPKKPTPKVREVKDQPTRSVMTASSASIQTDLYGFDIDESMRSANQYRNELTKSLANKKDYRSFGANTDIKYPFYEGERDRLKSQSDFDQSQKCDTLDNDQSTRMYNISVDSLDEISNSKMQEPFNNNKREEPHSHEKQRRNNNAPDYHDNQSNKQHGGGGSVHRSVTEKDSNPFPILYVDDEDEMDDAEQVRDFHSSSEADSSILDSSSHQERPVVRGGAPQAATKLSQYYRHLPQRNLQDIMSTSEEHRREGGYSSSHTKQNGTFVDVPKYTKFRVDEFSQEVDLWVHKNIYYQTAPEIKSAMRDDINSFEQEVSMEISRTHEIKNSCDPTSEQFHAVSSIYYPMRADYSLPNTCVVSGDEDSEDKHTDKHVEEGSVIKVLESNVFSNFHLTLYPEEEPMVWKAGQISVFTGNDSPMSMSKGFSSRSFCSNQLGEKDKIQSYSGSVPQRNSFNRSALSTHRQTNDQNSRKSSSVFIYVDEIESDEEQSNSEGQACVTIKAKLNPRKN